MQATEKKEEWGHPQGEPCPYCGGLKYKHEVWNALSRWLPATYICPECGEFEAFVDLYREGKDFAFTGLSAQVSIVVQGKAGHIPLAGERGRLIPYKEACLIAEEFNYRMHVDRAKEMALVGQSMRIQHQGF